MTGEWTVERIGDRKGYEWRVVWQGANEATARREFNDSEAAMRFGSIRLLRPDGHAECIAHVTVAARKRVRK